MAWQKNKIGEFIEKIDFSNDPNIFLFYRHFLTGLQAFANPQQTTEESFNKYKIMLRLAEGFLSAKFNFDFTQFRKEIEQQTENEGERLALEVRKIAELLDSKKRKIDVQIAFKKEAVDDETEKLFEDEDSDIDHDDAESVLMPQSDT